MQRTQQFSFGPYHLAGPRGPLLRKSLLVNLPPKAVALLWELVTHAGQVVTKAELFTRVWPEVTVGEDTLTSFIHLLRRALKDDPRQPRYIATVHRQGYRFIAAVITAAPVPSSEFRVPSSLPSSTQGSPGDEDSVSQPGTWNLKPETALVGREAELSQLHSLFAKALNGERQIIFVSGEAGVGKTTLIDAFLRSLEFRVQSLESEQVQSHEENQKAKSKKQK